MQTGLTKCAFKKAVIQNKSHLKNFTSVTMNHILHPKVEHIIDNRTRQVLDVLWLIFVHTGLYFFRLK